APADPPGPVLLAWRGAGSGAERAVPLSGAASLSRASVSIGGPCAAASDPRTCGPGFRSPLLDPQLLAHPALPCSLRAADRWRGRRVQSASGTLSVARSRWPDSAAL